MSSEDKLNMIRAEQVYFLRIPDLSTSHHGECKQCQAVFPFLNCGPNHLFSALTCYWCLTPIFTPSFPTSHSSVPFAHPQTNQIILSKSYSMVPSHQLSHPRTCPPVLPAYSPAFHPQLVLPDSIRSLSAQTKKKRTDLFLLPDPPPEA